MNTASLSVRSPEFIIYSFEKDELSKGSPVWQEYRRLADEAEALRRANALFLSAKFTRVEVRKRTIDELTGRISNEAIKIHDSMPDKALKVTLFLAASMACVTVAGLITYFSIWA